MGEGDKGGKMGMGGRGGKRRSGIYIKMEGREVEK
jgi:hypothetical protein